MSCGKMSLCSKSCKYSVLLLYPIPGFPKGFCTGDRSSGYLFCIVSFWKEECQTALQKWKKEHFGPANRAILCCDMNRDCPWKYLLSSIPNLILGEIVGCRS